jgi:ectoine hydroxylase-related dioxygenase (phytanoyl-CoA dioxygenase family)
MQKNLFNINGFIKFSNLFSEEFCNELKQELQNIEPISYIPFTDIPWGYGNLINQSLFKEITKNNTLQEVIYLLLGSSYVFNHLMINNKAAWIGSAVEWHQELSLVNTFAPGYTPEDDKDFLQIYIALDSHTQENGCLKIFPGSHKLGLLPHYDTIGYNLGHKKQVEPAILEQLNTTNPVIDIIMQPGDVLIFNPLLVHGSSSNYSPNNRKAIILQVRKNNKPKDKNIFEKATKKRTEFVVSYLENYANKLKRSNIYKDFTRNDTETTK